MDNATLLKGRIAPRRNPAAAPEAALGLPDEAALLARARRLDADALAQIHTYYYPRIYRYIVFHCGETETAEDLTSEVFMRCLTALHDRTGPRHTLTGWLFGVARHVVNDHHRRHYRRQEVELDESLPSDEASPAAQLEANLEQAAMQHAVRRAVHALTPDQRDVIALRIGQGLPIDEVARLLGKSASAVKQLQLRALAAIGRRLRSETNEP